jgi:CDP-diacylglycerol--glycerol-3-phosphate 3-phosphatidyltransferase
MGEQTADRWGRWQRWSATTLWIGLLVVTALGLLIGGWEIAPLGRFLAGVAGGLVAVSVVIGRPISRANRQPITVATAVTLGRGAALAVFAGFLPVGLPPGQFVWLPAGLFALAAGLDAVDGRLARRMGSVTDLGGRLDTEIDGLTVLFGAVFVVTADLVPAVFLLVGIARYLFVFGIWLRKQRGLTVDPLPPSQLRRLLGGLAMGAIWLALLPVPGATVSRPFALAVFVPFVLNFSRDWLAVSGRR